MCGIAGYNCTTEIAESIPFKAFLKGTQKMVEKNYHRGGDAAGFMLSFKDRDTKHGKDNSTYWWKAPGLGRDIAEQIEGTLTETYNVGEVVPNVLGIHTRAKSAGFSEKDNFNNHPVMSGDVLVTHNGMVHNHIQLKSLGEKLGEKDWEAGQVDSVAIPIMLRSVRDPVEEVDVVGRILPMFEGGFAYHAIWTKHPGVSLLVAGERYPLVVSIKDGIVTYASENDCIKQCVPKFGLDMSGALTRKMDPGTFLIVKEGEVVHKGTYDLEKKQYKKLAPDSSSSASTKKYMRWLPAANEWFTRTSVSKKGVTTGTLEDERYYSSIDHTLDKDAVRLLYKKSEGILDPEAVQDILGPWKHSNVTTTNGKPPAMEKGDSIIKLAKWKQVFEDVCEADAIWVTRDPDASGFSPSFMVYAWFGATEITMTDTASLVSVINWGDGDMERPVYATQYDCFIGDKQAREKEEKEKKDKLKDYIPFVVDTDTDLRKWVKSNSIAPGVPLTGEKVVGEDSSTGKVVYNSFPYNQPAVTTPFTRSLQDGGDFDKKLLREPTTYHINDPDIATWMEELTEKTVLESVALHMNPSITIPFLWTEPCEIHSESLVSHRKPLECINVVAASTVTCTFLQDIFAWQALFDDELQITYTSWGELSTGCQHEWDQLDYGVYTIWGMDITLLEREVCDKCGAKKSITDYPTIIRKFLTHFADDYTEKRKEDELEIYGGMYL